MRTLLCLCVTALLFASGCNKRDEAQNQPMTTPAAPADQSGQTTPGETTPPAPSTPSEPAPDTAPDTTPPPSDPANPSSPPR